MMFNLSLYGELEMEPKAEVSRTSCHYRLYPGGEQNALANYYFTVDKTRANNTPNEVWAVTIEIETSAGRRVQATVPLKDNEFVDIPENGDESRAPHVSGYFILREQSGSKAVFFGGTLWAKKEDAPFTQVHGLIAVV